MNSDDTIRMAWEAGATIVDATNTQCWIGRISFSTNDLERFATLVEAATREEQTNAQDTLFFMLNSERDSHAITKEALQAVKDECVLLRRRCEKYQLPMWKRALTFLKRFW